MHFNSIAKMNFKTKPLRLAWEKAAKPLEMLVTSVTAVKQVFCLLHIELQHFFDYYEAGCLLVGLLKGNKKLDYFDDFVR